MIEDSFKEKSINVIKSEQLKEKVPSIIACVGTPEHFKNDEKIKLLLSEEPIPDALDVDFFADPIELKNKGFESGELQTFIISSTDNLDKYSKRFHDCTGLIITGAEKGTNQNISFMSHQDSSFFLGNGDQVFLKALARKINEIKERCENGTIEAVIFGGKYAKVRQFKDSDPEKNLFMEEYKATIRFLSKAIENELGLEPKIVAGPKTFPGGDYVLYDNEHRRLYLLRNKTNKNDVDDPEKNALGAVQGFYPGELEEISKSWEPGEWSMPL